MAGRICPVLVTLFVFYSIIAVTVTTPVIPPPHAVTARSESVYTPSSLVRRNFHRPSFAERGYATHIARRGAQWVVRGGDTGNKIATRLGISFYQLAFSNPTVRWSLLQIGSSLSIPSYGNDGGHLYSVVAGDTGNTIAAANGITLAQLGSFNPKVDWYNLEIGRDLYIPSPKSAFQISHALDFDQAEQDADVAAKDTGDLVAPLASVSKEIASSTNAFSPSLTPGETSSTPSLSAAPDLRTLKLLNTRAGTRKSSINTSTNTYIVKTGDTGYSIAAQFGISFDILNQANPGVNWLSLQIGQSLNVPSDAQSTPTTVVPIPQATLSTQDPSTPTSTSNPAFAGYVTYAGAPNTAQPPYPLMSTWTPFAQLWTINSASIGTNCVWGSNSVPPNTESESVSVRSAILAVSNATNVDPSFILAVIMQESNGCVRVPTTTSWQGISNPGLMQSFNGRASCNSNGRMQQPCPDFLIKAMIAEGIKGNKNIGIVPALSLAAKQDGIQSPLAANAQISTKSNKTAQVGTNSSTTTRASTIGSYLLDNAMVYYQAARIYNSGSLSADGDLSSPTRSTRCYVSDIINRLLGWNGTGKSCSLT